MRKFNGHPTSLKTKLIDHTKAHGKWEGSRRWCGKDSALKKPKATKHGKACKFLEIEIMLMEYMCKVKNDGCAVSKKMLQTKALVVACDKNAASVCSSPSTPP